MKQSLLLTVIISILCTSTLTMHKQKPIPMSKDYTPLPKDAEVEEISSLAIDAAVAKCMARRAAAQEKKQKALLLRSRQQKVQEDALQRIHDILDQ